MAQSESNADGLLSLAEDDDIRDEYSGFLQSLHRFRKEGERKKQDTVHDLLRDDRKAVDAKTSEIYLRKELAAAFQPPKERLQTEEELDHNIGHLQQCSINAAGVRFAVQQTVINAQLQENLQQQMQTADEDLDPDLRVTLSASQCVLSLAARVAERVAAVEEKKRLLRERRVELAALHRTIANLWQQKEQRDLTKNKQTDSELMKLKREELCEQEDKMEVVVHMIQSLMTGMSSRWGTDEQYLDVLKACELFKNSRQTVNWDHIRSLLAVGDASEDSSD